MKLGTSPSDRPLRGFLLLTKNETQIPEGFSFEEAVTLPTNLVTVFNTMWADLGLPTPWPRPDGYAPPRADDAVLVWGAASSVGQYALQVLQFYGYRNVVATASPAHHPGLRALGAAAVYDYRSPTVAEDILEGARRRLREKQEEEERNGGGGGGAASPGPVIPLVIDCIGSVSGSIRHVARVAQDGAVVAVMLPVIVKHATRDEAPEYSMDVAAAARWAEGVVPRGVRTHFYWKVSLSPPGRCPSAPIPLSLSHMQHARGMAWRDG